MQNLKGIGLMTAGFAVFSIADLMAKILTEDFHPFQIAWSRWLGVAMGLILILLLKGPAIFKSKVPGLQIARGMFAVVSATCFIFAIRHVPLADAVAVTFAAPFMVTIFGALLLRERVGPWRWGAVLVGFIGTLVIIRPGSGAFNPAILLVLVAALAFACRQIISKPIGRNDPTQTTLAYTAVTALIILTLPLSWVWETPSTNRQLWLFLGIAILSGIGEFLIIRALEIAEAVAVTPMHYSLIIFSTLWGYLFFSQLPDVWTWVGTSIVIASGLTILYREHFASARPAS